MNSTSEIERRKEAAIDALRLKAFETNSDADRQAYFDAVSKWFQDRHIRRVNAERVPFLSVQGAVKAEQNITRPIVGIENRTAQEVFDIMRDRILSALEPSAARKELMKQIREGTAHGFLNDGSQPEDNTDLDCPYCCGSGHKGDVHPSAARELALEEGYRQGVEAAAQKAAEMLVFADTTSTADREIPAAIRALGTSCEQLNKAVSNVPDQQKNEPGAHGERERALQGERHIKLLAEALGKCLVAAGIVRSDAALTGPELLMFAEDLERALSSPDHNADAGKLVEGDGWLPFVTAPQDGTVIEAWHKVHKCVMTIVWKEYGHPFDGETLHWFERSYTTAWPARAFSNWRKASSAPSPEVAGS
ncbi:hypothetical protein R5W60_16600 [Brucella pseudintermedia]|uniref:hypothetical protein n=1 Tax=Brucella pseudintermedia TaxID=370111 RepID=UPI00366ABD5B|nr:hypothetical protein R5W60_16600 [Brucella pseudintermedia]